MTPVSHPSKTNLRLRLYVLLALFVALAATLGLTLYGALGRTAVLGPSEPARNIPNTDVNPYGANFFLEREVEPWKMDKTLHMAADAGIGWVKQHFPWEEIEPLHKGEYLHPTTKSDSWTKYDRIVEACEKYDLQIVARLDRPPDWTRQDNTHKQRPPDDPNDYGDYVYEFVKRYRGRINYIQVWNEPNIFPEWGNQPVDPLGYVELLEIAYRRAKEANPNVYVLSAPLAITLGQRHPEPGRWISMSDLTFLEEMYKAGAGAYFDIYSANAFGMDRPPEDPPDADALNFQRVLLQRRIMERYGDGDKAVWFNEYGWNAAPESMPPERLFWQRVAEREQAEYTLRGIDLARRDWPWAGVFMIWYFRQVGTIPSDRADYYFRMVDPDFTPRILYSAVQDAVDSREAPGPGMHQETSPGAKTFGDWAQVIAQSALGRGFVRSDSIGASVSFTFRGSGLDLLSRRWSGSGRLLVSLDGRVVAGLPKDAQGASYVDLYSPTLDERARVPLVRQLGSGEHTLRMTVATESHPSSSGRACVVDGFDVLVADRREIPILPLLLVSLGLGLDGWLILRTWRRLRGGEHV